MDDPIFREENSREAGGNEIETPLGDLLVPLGEFSEGVRAIKPIAAIQRFTVWPADYWTERGYG